MNDFTSPYNINMDATGVGTVSFQNQRMAAIFYKRPVIDVAKSEVGGRSIYKDVEYVRIAPPGERLNIVDRPATQQDRMIWPREYAQFAQNQEQRPDGTPVELLHPEQPSIGQTLRAHNVHTIEQLAQLSGNAIDNIGLGAQQYVNDAQQYIKAAESGAGVVQMRREVESLKRDKTALEQKLNALSEEITRLKTLNANPAANQTVSLSHAELAALISSVQQRPNIPTVGNVIPKEFDSAEAQIAANHPSKLLADNLELPQTKFTGTQKRKREKL